MDGAAPGPYDVRMSTERERPADGGAARLTPYEWVFGAAGFETEAFPAIQEEAEARGADPSTPERFMMLGTVGDLLRELMPEPESGGEAAEQLQRYGLLLYHGYHFWRFGRRLLTVETPLLRRLLDSGERVGAWELIPPHPAGYLQLPRHLVWSRVTESATPEPVDGLFWTMIGADDPELPPYPRLDLLLVLGLRPDRPGFSVVDVGVELTGEPSGHWADADARPGGRDFENVLPGGELRELYAIITPTEALKAFSRIAWYAARHPGAAREAVAGEAAGATSPHEFPASALPYVRLGLTEDHG